MGLSQGGPVSGGLSVRGGGEALLRVGGYQVLDRWLKDRKGRMLSFEDIMHYQRIVVALSETRRIMQEIDDLIPEWPLP